MEILLIAVQSDIDTIGLKYIHSNLCKNNIESNILFIPKFKKEGKSSLERFIEKLNPKIIGISLMSSEFYDAKRISLIIKKRFPKTRIVWGGIHPTIDPKECLNYSDYVVIGEAEQTFLELVYAFKDNKSVNGIENLAYKSNRVIIMNKLRLLDQNLDSLPFPEYFPKKSYILHKDKITKLNPCLFKKYMRYSGKFYDLLTSRGCQFSCTYCCHSFFLKLYGENKIRKRSVENVIEELKRAIKLFPNLAYISIHDDNFCSYDIEWMKKFCDAYKKDIKKKFMCSITPTYLTEEKISMLKKAGLAWICMALQSGSPRINRKIFQRYISNDKFIEGTKIIKKYNIAGYYDIIVDNPYATDDDLLQTIDIILKIPKPYRLQILSLCFYQGTGIHSMALKDKLVFENPLEKNYHKYQPTFFNRIFRLCPLLPKGFIRFLVKYRKRKWSKLIVHGMHLPSILILEPISLFRLTLISYDYNLLDALKTIFFSFKTGFDDLMSRM